MVRESSTNTLTQGSIDKLYKHAGRVNMLLIACSDLQRAMQRAGTSAWSTNYMQDAASRIAELMTPEISNDISCLFKELYNRQQGP